MTSALISNWNRTVRRRDVVYHLGDVASDLTALDILRQLNGRKILIRGNSDLLPSKLYARYFTEIYSYSVIDSFLLSHIPIYKTNNRGNIHGHLQTKKLPDPWYKNCTLDQTQFCPVNFEVIRDKSWR